MAVARITKAVQRLDMRAVRQYLESPTRADDDPGYAVCDALKDEWVRFVKAEGEAVHTRNFHWTDGTIFVVELPTPVHEVAKIRFESLLLDSTGTSSRHLDPRGSTYVETMAHMEPDASFGPTREIVGAAPPREFSWYEYHTLKVEVGVSRRCPDFEPWRTSGAASLAWSTSCASASRLR